MGVPINFPKAMAYCLSDFRSDQFFVCRVQVEAPRGISRVEYYIDANLIETNYSYPFNLEKRLTFLKNGFHNLKVRACDDVDNCTIKELEFNLVLESEPALENLSTALLAPSSGLAVSNFDFPLELKAGIDKPDSTAKINFYAEKEDGSDKQLIAVGQPINGPTITAQWNKAPKSGTYKVYAEAVGWLKQLNVSDKTLLIVNNTTDKPEKTE